MSHVVFQLPMMFVFHYVAPFIGIRVDANLPSWSSIILGTVLSFFIEDFYFYWVHRLLHWGAWYQYIHKIHHEFQTPIGMAAEYAHPVETLILGFGTMLGPFLFFDHIFGMYFYLFWRLYQTIEHHCGYEYPWAPSRWLPFWSGAQFHDYHHETFVRIAYGDDLLPGEKKCGVAILLVFFEGFFSCLACICPKERSRWSSSTLHESINAIGSKLGQISDHFSLRLAEWKLCLQFHHLGLGFWH